MVNQISASRLTCVSRFPSPCQDLQCLVRKDPISYYYPVINALCDSSDLLSLVRLGCSSKIGRSLVTVAVHNNLQDTINRALIDAAAPNCDSKRVCILQWLLAAASEHLQQQQPPQQQHDGLAGQLDAGSLLLVQHVPAAAAHALVAAGLFFNKQQLTGAAHAEVAGLEVWLRAHQMLNVPNVLLPNWAHTICCNREEALQQQLLYVPDVLDQLHMAFNVFAPQPADALTAQLLALREQPAQLQACLAQLNEQQAQQLLSTALLRRHFDAAASFEGLLHACRPGWSFLEAVTVAFTTAVQQQDSFAVACLCKLRSSQQLHFAAVAGWLLQGMQQDDNAAVAYLIKLPAARQLPVGSAVQLLQAALQYGFQEVVTSVCQQEAAQAIDAAAFTALLLTAVQQQQDAALEELLQLPQAEMLHAPAAQQLLQAAIDAAAGSADGDVDAFVVLRAELPAVDELGVAEVTVLLQSALKQSERLSTYFVDQLSRVHASQSLSPSCIVQLLTQALQQQRAGAAELLCSSFDGATGISNHSCKRLAVLAKQHGVLHKVALQLLSLLDEPDVWLYYDAVAAAAEAADAEAIEELAQEAGLLRSRATVFWPHVRDLLAGAAAQHEREVVAALCDLGVRQPNDGCKASEGVAVLLQGAVEAKDHEGLSILVREVLDSGSVCSAEEAASAVAQQMQAVLKQGDVQALRCLARSKAAMMFAA